MDPITSLQNPRIKSAARLRDARQRMRQGRILIDGAREIGLALRAGLRLTEVFVCRQLCHTEASRHVLAELEAAHVLLVPTSAEVFAKIAFGERAEGVLAVAEPPAHRLADLDLPADALVGVLEGIEKPGNVGAVLRSADGAGLAAVIVADGGTDLYNPNCIRASLGTIFTLPVCAAGAADVRAWLKAGGWRILAARVDGSITYTQADYSGRTAIVLGSEAHGLSAAWQGPDVTAIRLPMQGTADSLNVSATAAVLFYEALHSRNGRGEPEV